MSSELQATDAENWFVAQLRPNGLTRARHNLSQQGFNHFAPMRKETSLRAGMPHVSARPLFPGYIFVQFDAASRHWSSINGTRGITRLLLNDPRRPQPLAPQFMSGLLARCDRTDMLLPPEEFSVGDEIRVIAGPFAEIVSRVEHLEPDQRIRLLIDLMGQKVRVQIPTHAVEKVRA